MSFAVAALRASGPVEILDVANVATSFPGFAATARSIGLAIEEAQSSAKSEQSPCPIPKNGR
jgi:3-phosphoshikimate 1-carboxyvinyltransferase